ncbi:PRD domain-containing protein [Bacillus sp. SL00103]
MNDSIYVTLTDHITLLLNVIKKEWTSKCPLWEIKRLYKDEFMCGVEAIRLFRTAQHSSS